MIAVTITLSGATLIARGRPPIAIDWIGCLIAVTAAAAALRWKVAPAGLVLAGALVGRFVYAFL